MSAILLFVEKVLALFNRRPKLTYRQPGDGSDGTCDCIGLVIGALRLMQIRWGGIHGCNWAARKEFADLREIHSLSELKLGDVVLKAYPQGHSKWNLPKRYQKGGAYYNGDLKDYYHAGVVTCLNPLTVTHMTSPEARQDTTNTALSKWTHHSVLKCFATETAKTETPKPSPAEPAKSEPAEMAVVTPVRGGYAVVTAPSGKTVKMRAKPSTKCALYDDVPIGAVVTLVQPGETWAKISYGRRRGWYMMAKYLNVINEEDAVG